MGAVLPVLTSWEALDSGAGVGGLLLPMGWVQMTVLALLDRQGLLCDQLFPSTSERLASIWRCSVLPHGFSFPVTAD